MKNLTVICFFILTILISGCTNGDAVTVQSGNIGTSCNTHNECETPMQYLVKSSCPHGSLCITNKCEVVCGRFLDSEEDTNHPQDNTPYTSPQVKCNTNVECDKSCSLKEYYGTKGACVEKNCYCIMTE